MDRQPSRLLPAAAIGLVLLAVAVIAWSAVGGGEGSAADPNRQSSRSPEKAGASRGDSSGAGATGANAGAGAGGSANAGAGAVAVTPQSTRRVSGPHDDPVPILMYHVTKSAPAGTPYPDLWVSPSDFKGQMQWLADNGYTGITMAQLFKYWDEGFELPKRPVVITFDDGYPSHDKTARKVLAARGWPGVLFLELRNVGNPETGLTAAMVRRLIDSGWEIGSHTINHSDLTTVSGAALEAEIAGSRKQIAAKFDVPIDFFCYPAGKFDAAAVAAVKRAGYRGAVTVINGVATPARPYELARVRINGDDGVEGFASKMQQIPR